MKKLLVFLLFVANGVISQTIEGHFPQAKNTEIILTGHAVFNTVELSRTTSDSFGNFLLPYPKNYSGAANLQIKNITSVIILLHQENFRMQWNNLKDFSTLTFCDSYENDAFSKGISINQEAENKLTGLKFLLLQYPPFSKEHKWVKKETQRQEQSFSGYLKRSLKNSYAPYYLKIRKLITDFPLTANRYLERMPQHEIDFNSLDFKDPKLHSSGLFRELLDGYFRLMESHSDAEKMYAHINTSTDAIIKNLSVTPDLQEEVAYYLFTYFEQKSLFQASEHLALSMLNQSNCQLTKKNTYVFEHYRKLAIGQTAPNIYFNQTDLKSLNSNYKLVVFGASWCPNCQTDYSTLTKNYLSLKKSYGLEVLYISIDTDTKVFDDYYKDCPFITFCDGKGWETEAAKDYHVFATPTYVLVDKDLKIVSKIKSPEHLQAWLEAKGK